MYEIDTVQKRLREFLKGKIPQNITERTKEAVAKMSFLNEASFYDLLCDIYDEIEFREKNVINIKNEETLDKKRIESRRKLRILDSVQFIGLCIDSLMVINNRNLNPNEGVEEMMTELNTIYNELRTNPNEEKCMVRKLENAENIIMKSRYYFEFTKKVFKDNGMSIEPLDYMELTFENHFQQAMGNIIFEILDCQIFIDAVSKRFIGNPEFEYRRENIEKLKRENNSFSAKAIRIEMAEIFKLVLETANVYVPNYEDLKPEATELMTRLEIFVGSLKNGVCENGEEFLAASRQLSEKLELKGVEKNLVNAYTKQYISVQSNMHKGFSGELLTAVIEFTYFIKELFLILKIDTV